jgi:hypothetical protein
MFTGDSRHAGAGRGSPLPRHSVSPDASDPCRLKGCPRLPKTRDVDSIDYGTGGAPP